MHYPSSEILRFVAVILLGLALGHISGYGLAGLTLALFLYSLAAIYQTEKITRWLEGEARAQNAPDTGGAWTRLSSTCHNHMRELRRKHSRTKQRMRRYRDTAQALPDATLILDEHYRITWCNQAAEKLLGIHLAKDEGVSLLNLLRNPELSEFLEQAESGDEMEAPAPTNRKITLLLCKVVYGKRNILLTARDVSQRVELREMRRAFIANASHELRSPLTVMVGNLELINSDELPAHLRQPFQDVERHSLRMQRLVEDLLRLSHLEQTLLPEETGEDNALDTLLDTVQTSLHMRGFGHQHTLKRQIDNTLTLRAIPTELESLLHNLIGNAMQHTPDGTQIWVCWQGRDDGRAELTVEDNGPGVPREHLPRLTERFFRVDDARSRQSGGTGLGLAIVKHIVQRHGGELDISLGEHGGCRFRAVFPAVRVQR